MNDFMKLAWIDICKTGSYLVMNTPSAAPNLTEQLKKYASSTITDTLSERIFGEYSGTSGLYAHQLHKLKLLLNSIYAKTQSEELTLKDYAFALRNMLMHSQYKSIIKYLEKPSTTPNSIENYLYELEHLHVVEPLDAFTKTKYMLLYSFIKNTLETNKVMSRLALATQETYEMNIELDRYFEFISQNNAVSHKLQYYTAVPVNEDVTIDELALYFAQLHPENAELSIVNDTISAVALLQYLHIYNDMTTADELLAADYYFKNKYRGFEQALTTLGINVHEILQHVTFTTADLSTFMQQAQHDKLEKRKKQLVTAIINAATVRYLAETTERLNALFQQEPPKVTVQKLAKSVNEAPLKKELFDAKHALKQMETEQAQLKKQVKELQQQHDSVQQKLTATQLQNTSLQQQLLQATAQQSLSSNAQELVREIAFLTQELTVELGLIEETFEEPIADACEDVTVETSPAPTNYIEKIKHLKLAVVGGHDKYHTNIKHAFKQDVFTISPDRLNTDVSKLLNYDVLVFITSYNNHNLYNRSYDYVKKNQAKDRCLILNSQPSAKRLAQQIYEFAAQKELVH